MLPTCALHKGRRVTNELTLDYYKTDIYGLDVSILSGRNMRTLSAQIFFVWYTYQRIGVRIKSREEKKLSK